MRLLKHSRFLCYSVPSFGISTVSTKKSLSFNMFSTSAIALIKGWNCHQLKNNIRYKSNTNNTCVIIFLKPKVKNSQRWYLTWENPRGGFCCCCCCICISFLYLHFIFHLHFVVVVLRLSIFFIHICFPTSSLTLPFYTFSQAHHKAIHNTFIFNFSGIFLPRALRFWMGVFYAQAFFTLRCFTNTFDSTCIYQGLPGSWQFFPEVCRASYWSSKHIPGPSVCLIHSNPKSSYSERFSFKFYHILTWTACGIKFSL